MLNVLCRHHSYRGSNRKMQKIIEQFDFATQNLPSSFSGHCKNFPILELTFILQSQKVHCSVLLLPVQICIAPKDMHRPKRKRTEKSHPKRCISVSLDKRTREFYWCSVCVHHDHKEGEWQTPAAV